MENNFLDKYKKQGEQFQTAQPTPKNDPPVLPTTPVDPVSTGVSGGDEATDETFHFTEETTFKPPARTVTEKVKKPFPWIAVILGVVAVIIAIILIWFFNLGKAIPDMTGWSGADVELWARENNILLRLDEAFDETIPADELISQDPAAGETVASGGFLSVVISEGPDLSVMVEVPDLKNMTMDQVEAWAAENFMTKVRITSEASATIAAGKVISVTINDNTVLGKEVRRDSPVYVVFSKGTATGEAVKLPDFTTMSRVEAQAFADENGIILQFVEAFSDTYPKDAIYKQDIKAEETIYGGDTVVLNISKGKEILVLNFFEYEREVALLKASQAGIATVVTERYSTSSTNTLLSQSIKAGTLYEEGDVVELVYSLGNSFSLGSFVGQSETALQEWITPLNEEGASLRISAEYTASSEPKGTILSQQQQNVKIGINQTINIVVSTGQVLFVPDLVANPGSSYTDIITREKAIALCEAHSLVPIFIEQQNDSYLPGEVWEQSIAPGVEVQQGTTIYLRYNPVKQTLTVPSFIGMTESEIRAAGYTQNFSITFTEGSYEAGMEGKVTAQSVPAGSTVELGGSIELTVGGEDTPLGGDGTTFG